MWVIEERNEESSVSHSHTVPGQTAIWVDAVADDVTATPDPQ